MRDKRTTNDEQRLKIELLSQWKLEAEFCNSLYGTKCKIFDLNLKGYQ